MTQLATVGNLNESTVENGREVQALPHRPATISGLGAGYPAQWHGMFEAWLLPRMATAFPNPIADVIVHMQGPGLMVIEAKSSPLPSHAGPIGNSVQSGATKAGTTYSSYLGGRESAIGAIPYLTLVRGLLERDDLEQARKLLDALPSEASTAREVQRLRRVLAPSRVTASAAKDVDRSREYKWLRHHWENYRGHWVAVEGDDVIAVAPTLKQLRDALKALKLERPPLVQRLD